MDNEYDSDDSQEHLYMNCDFAVVLSGLSKQKLFQLQLDEYYNYSDYSLIIAASNHISKVLT